MKTFEEFLSVAKEETLDLFAEEYLKYSNGEETQEEYWYANYQYWLRKMEEAESEPWENFIQSLEQVEKSKEIKEILKTFRIPHKIIS